MEEFFVRCEPVVLLLFAISVIVLVPVGGIGIFFRKFRRYAMGMLIISCLVCSVFIRDYFANLDGRRPWLKSNDILFPHIFTWGSFNRRIVSVPISSNSQRFDVTFTRRGRYAYGCWIGEKQEDFSVISGRIKIRCQFHDEHGHEVFSCDSGKRKEEYWEDGGKFGGSNAYYGLFNVPDNLAYDQKYTVVIEFTGDIEGFRCKYPSACFIIDKWPHL